MIALGVYGHKQYKKHQKKKQEEKKRLEGLEVPPIVDQSAEFDLARTSTSSSAPKPQVEGGALRYSESSSSRYSSTASEPNSVADRGYAASTRSSDYEPTSAVSLASSEDYRKYQQYVERQSTAYLKEATPDGPPAYQATLSPTAVPAAPRGKWIYIPADDEVIDPRVPPTIPVPPRSPFRPANEHANELPAAVPAAAYASPIASEMPAQTPQNSYYGSDIAKGKATQTFELPADEPISKPRKSTSSDGDVEMGGNGGEFRRHEFLSPR